MKNNNSILVFILILINTTLNSQTSISTIKSTYTNLEGKISGSEFKLNEEQSIKINSILNLNVIRYYELKQYDTKLKESIYKKTDDYKQKLSELIVLKKKLFSTTYYLDLIQENDLGYYYSKYDIVNKTFTFVNNIYYETNINRNDIIQFDDLVFYIPQGFGVKKRHIVWDTIDFTQQSISFKIKDENIALKLEENNKDIRMLFVFDFTKVDVYTGNMFGIKYLTNHLLTKLKKVIVYNGVTDEIYAEYKPKISVNK